MMPSDPHTREISSTAIAYAESVEPGTAFLFGERDPRRPIEPKLGDDVGGKATVLLVLVDLVDDLALQEVADGSSEQLVLG